MFKLSQRPLQELQIFSDKMDTSQQQEILHWLEEKAQYIATTLGEYIISLPHPKHPNFGGQSFDEFTEKCPPLLKNILSELYEKKLNQMNDEKWTSDFDLENDFGFVLIVFF